MIAVHAISPDNEMRVAERLQAMIALAWPDTIQTRRDRIDILVGVRVSAKPRAAASRGGRRSGDRQVLLNGLMPTRLHERSRRPRFLDERIDEDSDDGFSMFSSKVAGLQRSADGSFINGSRRCANNVAMTVLTRASGDARRSDRYLMSVSPGAYQRLFRTFSYYTV